MPTMSVFTPLLALLIRAERGLARAARRQTLSIVVVGLLALGGSAATSLLAGIPQPRAHDEFSYLLAADTFAHGRLSNPTHPMWTHLESFHIIHQPTYASKYPPAQGLALALGQVIGGQPIVGVWISAGLACAALYWMLLAWLPPGWALLGGLLAVGRFGIAGYWSQSYWGGAVAVLGGALLFGALRRLWRRARTRDAALLGLGLVILAGSRPFEALLVSLPTAAVLGLRALSKDGPSPSILARRTIPPVVGLLALAGAGLAYYNVRVTGSPWLTPYQVYEATYTPKPLFFWQGQRPAPVYRHDVLRRYAAEGGHRVAPMSLLRKSYVRVKRLYRFPLGPLLLVPLVTLPWLCRNRWMLFALATIVVFTLGRWGFGSAFPHYTAPVTGLLFAVLLQGMRHVRLCRWGAWPVGRLLVGAIPLAVVLWLGAAITGQASMNPSAWHLERARILARLTGTGERHLVVVRYWPPHVVDQEWVYNGADIDGARVVWARKMDPARDCELLAYFSERRAWLLEADTRTLTPYPAPTPPAADCSKVPPASARAASHRSSEAQIPPP